MRACVRRRDIVNGTSPRGASSKELFERTTQKDAFLAEFHDSWYVHTERRMGMLLGRCSGVGVCSDGFLRRCWREEGSA
eukprot:m.1299042 g.1299042  ORF g.1299042 m.1299042 type:complete len:79 (-) comp24800_c0_seq11:3237-3473(-)